MSCLFLALTGAQGMLISVIRVIQSDPKMLRLIILTVMMIPCCDFYVPKIIPAKAPLLQNIKECFSSLIRIQNIVKAAAVIPTIQYKTNTLSTPY